jgi:hypothetical protein
MLHKIILTIFAILLPCSAIAANTISATVIGSNWIAQQQEDEDNQGDAEDKSDKKTRNKIRFSNWHSWVRWVFSMEKWQPAIDALKIVFDSLFDSVIQPYDHSIIQTDNGFPPVN